MRPSKRKYIKNCTGGRCEKNGSDARIFSRILFYILLVGFIGVSTYVLLFSPYMQISNISISGVKDLNQEEVLRTIETLKQGKFLGIVPKDNFLLIPKNRFEKTLLVNFKKIRSATAVKRFPDTVGILIEERSALLVWCSKSECFLVDENGIAYSQADFDSPEILQNNLVRISDLSGRAVIMGEKIIQPAYVQYILAIKESLKKTGIEPGWEYSTPSRMADEVDVKTQQGADILFSTQFPLESAIKTLDVVWKKEISQEIKEKIVYIDLRTENKAFYKIKSEEAEEDILREDENGENNEGEENNQ